MDGEQRPGVDTARVAAAFRAAAGEAPPAGFDVGDVVAASRRITRRRRSALAGGALAVLAVTGVGVAGVTGGSSGTELTTASAGSAPVAAPNAAARDSSEDGPVTERVAPPAPGAVAAGSAASAAGAPLGPGTGECANRQDPALRALVEQVLPETVGAPAALTTQECRPGGERGLALEVRDGATSGVLSVTYLPPEEPVEPPGIAEAPAVVVRTAPTASGGTVVVSSRVERAGDPSPFGSRLDAVVAALAPRL